jgi:peroxin-19
MASTEQITETTDKRDERETTPKAEESVVGATAKPVTDDEDSEWEDLDGMIGTH